MFVLKHIVPARICFHPRGGARGLNTKPVCQSSLGAGSDYKANLPVTIGAESEYKANMPCTPGGLNTKPICQSSLGAGSEYKTSLPVIPRGGV